MKEKEGKNKMGLFVSDNDDNIYVIGDIHGDYQCLVHCLVDLAMCCYIKKVENFGNRREILEWVENNKTILVFTGDLIHRQRFENNVLDDECSDIFIIKTLFIMNFNKLSLHYLLDKRRPILQFFLLKYLKYEDIVKFLLVSKDVGRLCDANRD